MFAEVVGGSASLPLGCRATVEAGAGELTKIVVFRARKVDTTDSARSFFALFLEFEAGVLDATGSIHVTRINSKAVVECFDIGTGVVLIL